MHLLILAPNLPRPVGGASTRNYHLLQALARQHTITLLALVDESELTDAKDRARLEQLTRTLKIIERLPHAQSKRWQQLARVARGQSYIVQAHQDARVQQALDQLAQDEQYDVVLVESALMAGYRFPEQAKIILDQHNLEYEILERTAQQDKGRLRRWYNRRESQLLKPIELERCRKADAVLMTSDREREVLQRLLPGQGIETVPNGVDTAFFGGTETGREVAGRIIFTGAMNYYPNSSAVLSFAQQCWPQLRAQIPDATWQIVGREPPEEVKALATLPGVQVTGSVLDVRPYLAEAQVAIVPLQIGSGTRLKILEALAARKAVVSTSVGSEGIAVTSGEQLLIEDQPQAFVEAIVHLLKNPQQRRAMGEAGQALVEECYSWEHCSAPLLRLLQQLKKKERVCS